MSALPQINPMLVNFVDEYQFILEALEQGMNYDAIRYTLNINKAALNYRIRVLKEAGYVEGDGRGAGLRVIRRINGEPVHEPVPAPPPEVAAYVPTSLRLSFSAHDLRAVLCEIRGGEKAARLFPDEWLPTIVGMGYATCEGDMLRITTKGARWIDDDLRGHPIASRSISPEPPADRFPAFPGISDRVYRNALRSLWEQEPKLRPRLLDGIMKAVEAIDGEGVDEHF